MRYLELLALTLMLLWVARWCLLPHAHLPRFRVRYLRLRLRLRLHPRPGSRHRVRVVAAVGPPGVLRPVGPVAAVAAGLAAGDQCG
jgi:hypothetical protein